MLRLLALLLAATWGLSAPPARAQGDGAGGESDPPAQDDPSNRGEPEMPPGAARLSWTRFPGAESCPSAGDLTEDVQARLGYDPFALPDPAYFIDGRVRPTQAGYRAELAFRDAGGHLVGERTLETRDDRSCGALARASALAVALVVDPVAALEGPRQLPEESGPATDPEVSEDRRPSDTERPWPEKPTPEEDVGRPTPPSDAPPDAHPGAPTLSVQLRLDANGGALPGGLSLGPGLLVVGRVPGIAVGVGAFYYPAATQPDFTLGLAGGWLDVCAAPELAPGIGVDLCLRGVLGARRLTFREDAMAEAMATLEEGETFWGGVGAAGRLEARLVGPLFVAVEVGLLVAVRTLRVAIVDVDVAGGETRGVGSWEEPRVTLTGALAAGLSF